MPQRGFLSPAEVRAVDAWVKEHAQGEDLCPVSSENDWITMDEVLFMPKFISKSEGSSGEGKQKEPSTTSVLTSEADLLIRVAFPVLILICVVAIILAGVLYKAQRSSIQTIKEETRDISGLVVDTEEPQIPAAS